MLHKESPRADETIERRGSPAKDDFVVRTRSGDGDQAIVTGAAGGISCDKLRPHPTPAERSSPIPADYRRPDRGRSPVNFMSDGAAQIVSRHGDRRRHVRGGIDDGPALGGATFTAWLTKSLGSRPPPGRASAVRVRDRGDATPSPRTFEDTWRARELPRETRRAGRRASHGRSMVPGRRAVHALPEEAATESVNQRGVSREAFQSVTVARGRGHRRRGRVRSGQGTSRPRARRSDAGESDRPIRSRRPTRTTSTTWTAARAHARSR